MAKKKKSGAKSGSAANSTTFRIVLLGAVIGAALFMFWIRPAANIVAKADQDTAEVKGQLSKLQSELDSFRSGTSFAAERLSAAVAPAERIIPENGAATASASVVEDLAAANGLSVKTIEYPTAFVPATGDLLRADMTMTVEGPVSNIVSWLQALQAQEQLFTVDTSGVIVNAGGGATMQVIVTAWATSQEAWFDGIDKGPQTQEQGGAQASPPGS